eukprot:scaffold6634_cov229-Ochromonas_danica.AAC.3
MSRWRARVGQRLGGHGISQLSTQGEGGFARMDRDPNLGHLRSRSSVVNEDGCHTRGGGKMTTDTHLAPPLYRRAR